MTNYMKSEFYRIFHGKTIYLMTLILAGAAVFCNVVLYLFLAYAPGFLYGNVRYAFIVLITGMQLFYIGALMVVMLLSSDEYKNGTMKNAVVGGMSRIHIFLGKCMVYGITATGSAAVILTAYISAAVVLLGYDPSVPAESSLPLRVLLTGAAANLPFSLASVVLTVALCQIFQKESQVYVVWVYIVCVIPQAFRLLGFQIPLCARIAQWMPWNIVKTQVDVTFNSRHMDAVWMYPGGFLKLMIVGAIGIVLFGAMGILGFRKKDIC